MNSDHRYRARVFIKELDQETEELRKSFCKPAQHWGLARKLVNVFLRDAFYTVYLHDAYALDGAESRLYIPLDSIADASVEDVKTSTQVPPANDTPAAYRAQLSEKLQALTPSAFERFAQRLLREAGFEQVTVTGK